LEEFSAVRAFDEDVAVLRLLFGDGSLDFLDVVEN
jgi:hypothetical protein